eukprot:721179-Amphidinium_carterae.1
MRHMQRWQVNLPCTWVVVHIVLCPAVNWPAITSLVCCASRATLGFVWRVAGKMQLGVDARTLRGVCLIVRKRGGEKRGAVRNSWLSRLPEAAHTHAHTQAHAATSISEGGYGCAENPG